MTGIKMFAPGLLKRSAIQTIVEPFTHPLDGIIQTYGCVAGCWRVRIHGLFPVPIFPRHVESKFQQRERFEMQTQGFRCQNGIIGPTTTMDQKFVFRICEMSHRMAHTSHLFDGVNSDAVVVMIVGRRLYVVVDPLLAIHHQCQKGSRGACSLRSIVAVRW